MSRVVSISLDPTDLKKLDKICKDEESNRSEMVKFLINTADLLIPTGQMAKFAKHWSARRHEKWKQPTMRELLDMVESFSDEFREKVEVKTLE